MSARDALNRYFSRMARTTTGPRRRNAQPEAELKTQVLAWLKVNGFSCHAIESRAVYNARAGRFLRGMTSAGTSDIFGSAPDGTAVFIELKSLGRKSTLKPHQREFLVSKINCGAFAVCADSVGSLADLWRGFLERHADVKEAKHFLLTALPKEKTNNHFSMEE